MTAILSDVEASALAAVDEAAIARVLLELLAVPSVTGSAAESELQHVLARHPDIPQLVLGSTMNPEPCTRTLEPGTRNPRPEGPGKL